MTRNGKWVGRMLNQCDGTIVGKRSIVQKIMQEATEGVILEGASDVDLRHVRIAELQEGASCWITVKTMHFHSQLNPYSHSNSKHQENLVLCPNLS